MTTAEKLLAALKEAAAEQRIQRESELYEKNPENYDLGDDCDYVDNGLGQMCVRREHIIDDDKLYQDALEYTAEDFFCNCSECGKDTKTAEFVKLVEKIILGEETDPKPQYTSPAMLRAKKPLTSSGQTLSNR